jgi:flagellar FliL protein
MAKVALVKEAPPEAVESEPAPKKGKGKLIVIGGLTLLLLAGGGGGGWYYMNQKSAEHAVEKPVAEAPPMFLPIDQFTVNLNPEGGEQFLQAAFTLKVTDQEVVDAVKLRLPEVRNRILLLLSSKKASELTTVEGKQKLAEEIQAGANEAIAPSFPPAKKGGDGKKGSDSGKAGEHAKAAEHAKPAEAAKPAETAKADEHPAADAPAKTGEAAAAGGSEPVKTAEAAKPAPAKPAEAAKPALGAHAVTGVMITHFIIQ